MVINEHLEGLTRLSIFVDKMNQTTSNLDKLETLKDHSTDSFIVKSMEYTYNPYKTFGVHRNTAEKHGDLAASLYADLFGLLDDLIDRNITGHHAITAVNGFAGYLSPDQCEVFFRILDGDLKMRASASMINKAIPGCIPTFSVALAQSYEPKLVDFKSGEWYGSRKLDGVRCICIKENDIVKFFSRSGKEFLTLDNLKNEILKLPEDFVLDGEICMVDDDGNEDFQGIMKQIRKKDHQIKNPKFFVFDYLTLKQFNNKSGNVPLKWRLDIVLNSLPPGVDFFMLEFLPQIQLKSEDQFTEMVKDAEDAGFEGIMLRKNVGYEGKRSKNLLKVKKFYDAEYIVENAFMGNIRWVENGKDVEKECLSYVTINHKGHEVRVGSGFSKDQRELYYKEPVKIIGKTVTIQYFEESINQDGGISLRFPTIKHIYDTIRTV